MRPWPLLALLLTGSAALAQDAAICDRGEGVFYGQPFTLEQTYLIPGDAPPAPPSGDDLFPDPGDTATSDPFTCSGGGIVGALDCVTEEIAASGTAPTDSPPLLIEAEARAAAGLALADTPAPPTRIVRQMLVLKPVIIPGAPGSVQYVPAGPGGIEVPEDLTEAEIAALAPVISARNAALLDYRGSLSLDQQDDLIRGMPLPIPTPPEAPGVRVAGDPAVLAIGAECGALFRAMTETARLIALRAEKQARIKRLKDMLKAERDKAGLLGLLWDSSEADRLERIIAYEEGNVAKIDQLLAEHQATIKRRTARMAEDDRTRELEAIKADPDRLATETQRRRDAIIDAAREAAKARWLMIEGEAAYARQLAAHDAMIKAARENGQDDLADKLEEDKSRLESARDSWRAHAQSMIDVRTREEARLMAENAADGIGPIGDATSILLAEGKNPVEVIETGARDGARASAERRALTDSATLGGTATETYDALDFGQDLFETNLEMQRNPALFYRRFGSYVGGAAEAAYDGVVDLAVIGVEAGDLAGEVFESHLSGVTGYEFNTFGRENLDTLVAAGTALSETDALKIGALAESVAEAADRRVSRMASSGEAGIREALSSTGYIAGSVLGAEELAMAGAMRAASAVRSAARGAEALADASKIAEGVTDASRIADAAKVDPPPLPDAPKLPDSPTTPDAPKTPDTPLADTAKVDPEDLTDTVIIDPPKADPPVTPDPVTPDPVDPDKSGPTPTPDPAPPVTPDPATPDPATPDPDTPTSTDPEDLAETVKADPPGTDPPATPDPDKTGPAPAPDADTPVVPDPASDPKPMDRDAATEKDPTADPDPADPAPVDRDAVTEADPADPGPVDRDAVTERNPDTDTVDRDATTERDPSAEPDPADRDAVTEPDPDLTSDLTTDATADPNLDEAVAPPVSKADPPADPVDPANEPLNDPDAETEPPLADTDPPLAVDAPPSPVDDANLARGPPDAPRDLQPIDKTKLDQTLDKSDDYTFGKPLYDPALIPQGGSFGGDVSFATNAGTTRQIPGQTVTAPDGTLLELGPLVGTGATATVFASKTDPSKVIRLVEFTDPTAGALDAVGRKVGEAIQDPTGNGNFRLTDVAEQFTAVDPATGNTWLVTVEENLAATGSGITNAKKRFADRAPNAEEELTMALAMREMNDKGVVWTDHKPANFDIVPNPDAPTGYQMVIFDTGGIRPVTGATEASRARTALEVQHTFDSVPYGNSPLYPLSEGNIRFAGAHLDDRVFGVDEMGVTLTRGSLNRADGYLELSSMSDDALETYARTVLGPGFKLNPGP